MTEHSKATQDGKVVRQHCIGEKEEDVSGRQPSILRYSSVDGIHSGKERKVRFSDEPVVADDDQPAQDQAEGSPSAGASARESSPSLNPQQYYYHKYYYHDNNVPHEQGHGEYAAYEPHTHQQPGYYAYPYAYPYACWMPQHHFAAQNHDSSTPIAFANHPETSAMNGQTLDQISSTSRDTSMMQLKAKSVCITVNTADEDHPKATKTPNPTGIPSYWPEKNGKGLTKEELGSLEETQLAGFGQRHLRRSCMLRVLNEWRKLCDQRWWKSQILLREQQNALLISQINHMEHRPVRYLYRNRVRAWLRWWLAYSKRKTLQKQAIQTAQVRYTVSLISHVWSRWLELVLDAQAEAVQSNRAANISDNRRRRSIFKAWRIQVGTRNCKRRALEGAIAYRRRYLLHRALGSWFYLTKVATMGKAVASRHVTWLQIVVFKAWRSWVAYKGSNMTLVRATLGKRDWSLLQQTLYIWLASVDAKRHYRMRVACARLQAENQRLMIENDRLNKFVDSGELERKRLEELNLVGQALEQERSALMAMMGKTPDQVFKSTRSSEDNKPRGHVTSRTRNTSLDTENCSKQTNKAPHGSNYDFTAQNKIRVQAGSSFNALVRALKQDLLATGALKRDPDVAYAVDKLSLSQVELIEEGGLRVAACENTAHARGWTMPKSSKDNKFMDRSLDSQSLGKEETKGFRGGGRSVNLPLNSSSLSKF